MLFANNANTTLSSGITASATSISVTSSTAFPNPISPQYFYCTLADTATQTIIEIIKVTAISGTTWTVIRGQDGTLGTAFLNGDVVSLRLVRASLNDFPKLDETNIYSGNQLIGQASDLSTGVLQVTGQATFTGSVTDKNLYLQGGNNLILNSATLVTQNITVTANAYTLSMTGTGTITLSGTSTGTLVGTGVNTVVSKTFTPTAGTLTLTPTGSCTTVQLELGNIFSSYTATTGTAVTTTNNIIAPSGSVTANNFYAPTNLTTAYGFTGNLAGSGFGSFANNQLVLTLGGVPSFRTLTSQTTVPAAASWGWSNSANPANGTDDLTLYRDSANTLAQRNSTNAQAFRLYNTYTSSTSYENLQFDWTTTANTATISTQKGSGGGTARTLAIGQPLVISPGYTVATLPAGVVGMRAYVTNALAPSYGVAVAGGGAVTIPVFYNGTNWIVG